MTWTRIGGDYCSLILGVLQYMSVSHGYNTIGGIEYGGCGEDNKKDKVSHQLGILTGYGDAHQ